MPELGDRLYKEMNKQIQEEVYSAYLYFSMAGWFDANGFPGFASWMRRQAMEELTHAQKFYNHINERRREVELLEIKKPDNKWGSPLEVFEAGFNHEIYVSGKIHDLMKIAREENDFAAEMGLLQWFIDEQIEEEETANEVVTKLKMIGDNKHGLYQLDKELGARAFTLDPAFKW